MELELLVADELTSEFGLEDVHVDVVVIFAIDEELVAGTAGFLEAAFGVAATGALVARDNAKMHAVQVEIAEAVFEQQVDSFGAVAVAVKVGVADEDTEHSAAGGDVELLEAQRADELVFVFGDDVEIAAVLAAGEGFETFAFGDLGEKFAGGVTKIIGDPGVVEPCGEELDGFIGHLDGGEVDALTDEFFDEMHGVPFRLVK